MIAKTELHLVPSTGLDQDTDQDRLNRVFFALSDKTRRALLERLDGEALLVTELAAPCGMSLQAVSRHIQVLVRAGLIQQARSGRISRCSLDAGPLLDASVWLNRYSKYWQHQFDVLAATLADIDARQAAAPKPSARARRKPAQRNRDHQGD